jgi:colanic acid biosynthesis glycosyl transferase WcaI
MRVTFLNRSYYPDVEATGQLLAELAADLARDHKVTVIAGRPNFVSAAEGGQLIQQEEHEGVRILRVRNVRFKKVSLLSRAIGLVSYLVLAVWAALTRGRPDVIVVETDPPMLGLAGAILKWWHRCPLIFYLQDLFPEVGLVLGRLRPGLLTRTLYWMTQVGLTQADRVIVLGDDMRRRVIERGIDPAKVVVVPNWADTRALQATSLASGLRDEWGVGDDRLVVMYSGNLGLSQNLDQVLVAAEVLRHEPVLFLLVGDGAAKRRLMETAEQRRLDNVRFLPYQPKSRLGESLAAADVHLIPLQKGLAGYIVPSKLYGILAVGRPYIAAVDAASEVATITREHQTGLRIDPDSAEALTEAIRWCLVHKDELEWMGRRGRELAEKRFDRSCSVGLFAGVLNELAKNRALAARLAANEGAASFPNSRLGSPGPVRI